MGVLLKAGRKEGTIFRALKSDNVNNNTLSIGRTPPKKEQRLGGYMGAPSWKGCFLILENSSGFNVLQVNYSEKDAEEFRKTLYFLFRDSNHD